MFNLVQMLKSDMELFNYMFYTRNLYHLPSQKAATPISTNRLSQNSRGTTSIF